LTFDGIYFSLFSHTDKLERGYHRKNGKVKSHKIEIEHQKQPNSLEIPSNAGWKKASVVGGEI
jgi:hypothetical protein